MNNTKNNLFSLTSYGIVVYRIIDNKKEYLMVRRKNSFGYIDFIRGKYSLQNLHQVQNMINEMSLEEKNNLLNYSFVDLWYQMWGNNNIKYKIEENTSIKKFEELKKGVYFNSEWVTLKMLINSSSTQWEETEWEFPKGRRNYQEKDIDCAIREFEEETGLSRDDITIIDNVMPFEEMYIGSNHRCYKHKYFLAYMSENDIILNNYQKAEVSKLEWKNLDECLKSIRPYNLEKKILITKINKLLQEYRIYS